MSSSSPITPMRTRRGQGAVHLATPQTIDWNGFATLDQLSEELLDRVIHFCVTKRSDLLELLRIKPLHNAALRHVWRRLAFDLASADKNERLLRALSQRPELGENIRRISLRREAFSTIAPSHTSPLERAILLLQSAPALTDLEIKSRLRQHLATDERDPELEAQLQNAFSTFKETLKRFVLNPQRAEVIEDVIDGRTPTRLEMVKPFCGAFSAFSQLTVLDLWEVSFIDSPVDQIASPTFKLVKLVMASVTMPAAPLEWLTAPTAASGSLIALEVRDVTPGSEAEREPFIKAMNAFVSAIAPTVQLLTMERTIEGLFADEDLAIPLFSRFASLQRLVLDTRDLLPAAWNALSTGQLRHTLRAVDLQVVSSVSPSSVTATLGKLQPALRRVSITTHRGMQLIQAGSAEPQVWTWSRADRRSLRAVCITHGIPLEIDGIFEADDVELSSADEADAIQVGDDDEAPAEDPDMDDLFVLDDERRARYEEELTADRALLEEATRKGDIDSQDEFMDALTSSEGEML